jgi:hypothetical protein
VVQVKYRANKWASVSKWGQLPQQIRHELTRHDTVNLTVFTATNEFSGRRPSLEIENLIGVCYAEKSIRQFMSADENGRLFIRVIDRTHLSSMDSFYLWTQFRKLSG